MTTTTEPPVTVPPTKTPTTHAPKPSGTPTPTRPHGPGKAHTPSVVGGLGTGAPHTGGSGQDTGRSPANTLVGGGLLFAALGLLSGNVLRGRKTEPDSAS
ncbi:MAG TPA: hypothetical protein VFM07_04230 [Intrasporangium sp.]|nr:hypothetical protein [Intrasporangium sp.]